MDHSQFEDKDKLMLGQLKECYGDTPEQREIVKNLENRLKEQWNFK